MDRIEPRQSLKDEPGVDRLFWMFLLALGAACLVAYYMADWFFFY